ncbi:SusC/RagA family TonB-linked outer membrane protein [Flavihumibacter sp. RY-1]|uniref:SusC/RagA family TonB-linked outer membrane protein n=1 Tax=Flavihumibacter fluminis TaxID=2909236 RepID=A0ABS9BF45_9BACT|nr:SusC/RagA family TonB-linked outer membrane protein [Flavihumibacter fluminis]MCF1713910.1 SusC/RagA family TonB-linked outer membrane protein [Flavihumibacter fluminis]
MRKILSLLVVGSLCCSLAFGQTRPVTGKIVDDKGNPVPYATVKVKGSTTGVSADVNGVFTIRVKTGDVLEVSAIGQKTNTITINQQNLVTVSLESSGEQGLQEVVVTGAYNIKRTQRSTSSTVQTISDEKLNTIRQPDVNNALAGKVAGVQVRSQSAAKLGANGYAQVRLRGESELVGGSNVLYVIDGTIMPSGSAGDINPDDIEDLSVLQGPASAAIFGAQGAGGAIVITTKRAKKNQRGIGVELNTGVTLDKIYILPDYQNSYAGGGVSDLMQYKWQANHPEEWKALDGKYYHDYSDDASWGPRMVGQEYIPWYAWYPGSQYSYKTAKLTPQSTNSRDFYNTGVSVNNNVSLSKAGDNYSLRVSYTNLNIQGLIPTSSMKRNNLSVFSTVDITSRLTLGTNITYLNQKTEGQFDDGYSNNSTGSFNQWFHRNLDMDILKELRDLRSPQGALASWNHKNPDAYNASNPLNFYGGNYWYNFYSYFDNIKNINNRDRLYGDISLAYKITNDLKVKFTYRKNQLTTFTENKTYSIVESSATQSGAKAGYGTSETYSNRDNFEGLLSYSKKLKDFSFNGNIGFDIMRTSYKDISASTVNGLNVPDFFALSNSKNPISYGNYRENSKYRSGFVRGDIGWRNMLFVDFTFRQDYYSTLPPTDNGILSKSVGGSFVFSDLLRDVAPFISFGKLRASWGEIPKTIDPYLTGFNYGISQNQWNGNFLMGTPNRLIDPKIRGSVTTQRELGLDMKFFKNRFGFSFTYWDGTVKEIPLDITTNGAGGFTSLLTNAGEISKKGIEVLLNVTPVRTKDINWEITGTFARLMENQVEALAGDLKRITNASGAFAGSYAAYVVNAVGKPWGQLFGPGFKRINGVPQLNASGLFVREPEVNFGSVLPDYTGGVQNTIGYKNFYMNINIDFQKGGKFFSLSDFWGSFSGLTAKTAALNDKGNPVRDAVEDGGGVRVDGVDADGKAVTFYVDAQTYYHQFQSSRISENSVYDLTFVKLRELSLGYRFNVDKMGLGKVLTGANFSIVARNPWLIYAKTRDFDPSEISNTYGENGQMPGTRSIGVNLKLNF